MHPNPTLLARRARDQQQDALALAALHRRAAQATGSERQPLLPQVLRAVRAAILPLAGRVAAGWQRPGSAFPRPA